MSELLKLDFETAPEAAPETSSISDINAVQQFIKKSREDVPRVFLDGYEQSEGASPAKKLEKAKELVSLGFPVHPQIPALADKYLATQWMETLREARLLREVHPAEWSGRGRSWVQIFLYVGGESVGWQLQRQGRRKLHGAVEDPFTPEEWKTPAGNPCPPLEFAVGILDGEDCLFLSPTEFPGGRMVRFSLDELVGDDPRLAQVKGFYSQALNELGAGMLSGTTYRECRMYGMTLKRKKNVEE